MKKYWLILLLTLACAASRATTITVWDFDFPAVPIGTFGSGDNNSATGTFLPNGGSGTLTNIGTTTNIFGTPPQGGGTATSDGDVSDNSALRLGLFPGAAVGNKTAGIQCFTSTAGFENIIVTFDQENSATASKYWRVQYTIDHGTNWVDNLSYTANGGTGWTLQRSVDLSTATGVRDNTNFGFRIVSEFQSTATGSGTAGYVGNSTNYGTSGTLWLDMVTISGSAIVATTNTPPTISAITNQSIPENSNTGPISFTVGDAETPAGSLILSASSGNQTLVQNTDVSFGGSGSNRIVTVTPEPNQSGSAQITVTVTDGSGAGASSLFTVVVRQPQTIISNQAVRINNPASTVAQITDFASFLGPVTVTADSTNTSLLPDANISISGSGSNRTITLTPVAGQTGVSLVTLTATDGSIVSTNSFYFRAVPTNVVTLWDFNSKILDFNQNTADINPIIGAGTAASSGSATNSLNSTVSAINPDPEQLDNSKWRSAAFAPQGTSNKTSGVELHVSTVGYQNIAFNWDQYQSATASLYWHLQYSLDGVNFIDYVGYSNNLVTTFVPESFSFGGIPGANNNPNFAVRIVNEFESTAVGTANANYVGTGGGYSSGGTFWLDELTFTGDPFVAGGNTPPVISDIADQTSQANLTIGPIAFQVSDAQTASNLLAVSGVSSAPGLIANNDLSFGGSGNNRTLTIHPEPNQTGTAQITVTVDDGAGGTSTAVFNVTVTAPIIAPANQTVLINTPTNVSFSVASFLGTVTVTATSENTTLLNTNIVVSGSGASRTLTLTPEAGQTGAALVDVSVSDGTFTATNSFYIRVLPANTITVFDFNSVNFDANASTGNFSPSFGPGSVRIAGPTTNSINSNVAATNSDPETLDNSKLRFSSFANQSSANKTAGVEYRFNTTGYQNIRLAFDQYNSASASEFWRVQYTLDGTNWVDYIGYTNNVPITFFTQSVDFSSISGANNNARFAVRLVAEFQSTATGSGADVYAAVNGGAYGTAGTLWMDNIILTGDAVVTGPKLSITSPVNGVIKVSWPTSAAGAVLQGSPTLASPNWQTISQTPVVQGTSNVVSFTNVTGNQFFHLVH